MRIRWLLVSIWICFLFRGWFYASMFPLWEGYDEFARFGVTRAMTAKGVLLVPRDQPGPRDVEESLKLAPVPWEVRGWDVFRSSLTEEAYWGLPPEERHQREARLRDMPPSWEREDSVSGVSAYEALQPPTLLLAHGSSALRSEGLWPAGAGDVVAVDWCTDCLRGCTPSLWDRFDCHAPRLGRTRMFSGSRGNAWICDQCGACQQ